MVDVFVLTEKSKLEYIEGYNSLEEAFDDTRSMWMEQSKGLQVFFFKNMYDTLLATMVRDCEDPEICHTMYADGRVEHHRCHYVTNEDGDYIRTIVTELKETPTKRL